MKNLFYFIVFISIAFINVSCKSDKEKIAEKYAVTKIFPKMLKSDDFVSWNIVETEIISVDKSHTITEYEICKNYDLRRAEYLCERAKHAYIQGILNNASYEDMRLLQQYIPRAYAHYDSLNTRCEDLKNTNVIHATEYVVVMRVYKKHKNLDWNEYEDLYAFVWITEDNKICKHFKY